MGEIVLGDFSLQFSLNNPVSCIHALALAKLKRFNKVVMETDNLCEGVKVCLGNRIWIIYPLAETRHNVNHLAHVAAAIGARAVELESLRLWFTS
ncbi:unnamed protein product [Prunus armeniaca]